MFQVVKNIFILFVFINLFSCQNSNFQLKEGHILFQDLDKDSIDNAIEMVTKTKLDYNFTHVAIVINDNNTLKVLEAVSSGVKISSVKDFLHRNLVNGKPKVVVGELKPEFRKATKKAIEEGKKLVGLPYDHIYKLGDSTYYCSELLYEMYARANPKLQTFQLNPMTFKNPKTNETLKFWEEYYKELNHKIPEGELGLNPNGMSVSPNIILIYDYVLDKKLN